MRPGSHAAGDGSFGRSAGIQAGRAAGLLVVAVLIGLALLHRSPGGALVSTGGTTPSTTPGLVGGGSDTTLRPTSPTSRQNSGTTSSTQPPRAKADIKVLVANGTSTPGLASTVSNTLRSKGYNTLASTNASLKVATTTVSFQPGYDADAAILATGLGLPANVAKPMPTPLPVPSLGGANIVVVVGPDVGSAPGTTTTTSRGAPTTVH